jgi:hypothetical protein
VFKDSAANEEEARRHMMVAMISLFIIFPFFGLLFL